MGSNDSVQQGAVPNFDRMGPGVGERFPDVVLPDQHGQPIDLHKTRAGPRAWSSSTAERWVVTVLQVAVGRTATKLARLRAEQHRRLRHQLRPGGRVGPIRCHPRHHLPAALRRGQQRNPGVGDARRAGVRASRRFRHHGSAGPLLGCAVSGRVPARRAGRRLRETLSEELPGAGDEPGHFGAGVRGGCLIAQSGSPQRGRGRGRPIVSGRR